MRHGICAIGSHFSRAWIGVTARWRIFPRATLLVLTRAGPGPAHLCFFALLVLVLWQRVCDGHAERTGEAFNRIRRANPGRAARETKDVP